MLIDIGENKPIILRRDAEEANGKTGTRVDIILEGRLHPLGPEDQRVLQADRPRRELRQPDLRRPDRQDHHLREGDRVDAPRPQGDPAPPPRRRRGGVQADDQDSPRRRRMKKFMGNKHFHRVGETNARKFLEFAGIEPKMSPGEAHERAGRHRGRRAPAVPRLPPAGLVLPLARGRADSRDRDTEGAASPSSPTVVARPPSSYSGFPFLVEVGLGIRREGPRAREEALQVRQPHTRCSTTRAATSRSRSSTRR